MSEAEAGEQPVQMEQASRVLVKSTAEVGALRQAVESQGLRLDPAAGEQILAALDEHRTKVDAWLKQAGAPARHAPLGENPVGTGMAAKFANRAEGHEHSFSGVLQRYREVLDEAYDAVRDAMRTYREADNSAADSFRKLIQ